MDGLDRVNRERMRQIATEGFTAAHDDEHVGGELAWAAVAYAAPRTVYRCEPLPHQGARFADVWPETWSRKWDKRERLLEDLVRNNERLAVEARVRNLVKAGALIAAEIDRLLRLPLPPQAQE